MHSKTHSINPSSVLERLTRPSEKIAEQIQRQQARALARLSLALLLCLPITLPVWILSMQEFTAVPYISTGILLALSLVYGLSRSRFYYAGAGAFVSTLLGVVVVSLLTAPPDPITAVRLLPLKYLAAAVLVSTMFLRRRITLLVFVFSLTLIASFFLVTEIPFMITYAHLIFFVVITALGVIGFTFDQAHKQRLINSEMRYGSLIAALSEGVVLHAQDGAIEACNAAAERILGLTAQQMMGLDSVDTRWQAIDEDGSPFPGEDHPAMFTLRTGQPCTDVIMGIQQPDGQRRWISINSQPLIQPGIAAPHAVVVSFSDITERKQRERQLQEAQRRYYALFEQAHDAVFILNLEGQHLQANQRAAEMLGYTVAEIQHLAINDLSAEPVESQGIRERLLAGKHIPVFERLFRKKDGTLVPVEIRVELVRDLAGNPLHIQSVVRDIAERKQAEEALRQSEARQYAMLSAIPDLIFRNHIDGTYLDYHAPNPGLLLIPPDIFMGRKIAEVLPEPLAQEMMALIQKVSQTGQVVMHKYTAPIDGKIYHFETRLVPIGNEEVLSITRDITELTEVEARNIELAVEKERVQLLTSFIQNASHEFRTPLTIINTTAYIMAHLPEPEKREQKLVVIHEQVERMTKLINMLLVMTRLENSATVRGTWVDIGELLENLCQNSRAYCHTMPIIQCQQQTNLPQVWGDPEELQEALKQILHNACRFTQKGSLIEISAGVAENHIWVKVQDTGPGIPPEKMPRIFETFWREDEMHSTPGFGLGLPIAQKIITRHGGKIDVESKLGQGSTFRVILPLRSENLTTYGPPPP
jgi:PAS domain S-box-containing protein